MIYTFAGPVKERNFSWDKNYYLAQITSNSLLIQILKRYSNMTKTNIIIGML